MVSVATAMHSFLSTTTPTACPSLGANTCSARRCRWSRRGPARHRSQRAAIDAGDAAVAEESGVIEEVSADYITVMHDNGTRRTYRIASLPGPTTALAPTSVSIVIAGD